jgi:hypothetical protein
MDTFHFIGRRPCCHGEATSKSRAADAKVGVPLAQNNVRNLSQKSTSAGIETDTQTAAPELDFAPRINSAESVSRNVSFAPKADLFAKTACVQILWGERRGHGTMGAVQYLPMELTHVATFSF